MNGGSTARRERQRGLRLACTPNVPRGAGAEASAVVAFAPIAALDVTEVARRPRGRRGRRAVARLAVAICLVSRGQRVVPRGASALGTTRSLSLIHI